jgi:mono/diheme cytochrome c family protein
MADDAGWTPGALTTRVGDSLTLRLTSDDVMHGFAIGQSAQPALDLAPGKWVTTTLVFDRPGRYTFYCTRWCGPNHWRMRGTIDVSGPPAPERPDALPLFLRLKLDLDKAHPSDVTPTRTPSAEGAPSNAVGISNADLRTQSPAALWHLLRTRPANRAFTDQQVWDVVAEVFRAGTSEERIAEGRQLYGDHCAACHGEVGRGDGVMAKALASDSAINAHAGMPGMSGHGTVAPTDFTNAKNMLGVSAAFLQGKIIRGGMGTGMPYWGPIFTERQLWSLVDYLWTFQFDYGSPATAPTSRKRTAMPVMTPDEKHFLPLFKEYEP